MYSFYKRNATTRAGFILWYSSRASRSDGETFFIFTYIWKEYLAKIPKVPGAQRDVNPARQ